MSRQTGQLLLRGGGVCESSNRAMLPFMNALKLIWLTIVQLVRQACLLPKKASVAVRQRRQQTILDENEAERLDRIRNPSKYLGK
jgi:hypothetical protein